MSLQKEALRCFPQHRLTDSLHYVQGEITHVIKWNNESMKKFLKRSWGDKGQEEEMNPRDQQIMKCILARVDKLRNKESVSANVFVNSVEPTPTEKSQFRIVKMMNRLTMDDTKNISDDKHLKSLALSKYKQGKSECRTNQHSQSRKILQNIVMRSTTGQVSTGQKSRNRISTFQSSTLNADLLTTKLQKLSNLQESYENRRSRDKLSIKKTMQANKNNSKHDPRKDYDFYMEWVTLINWTNSMHLTVEPSGHFKALIEKGNNHQVVKQVLRSRWWWSVTQCTCLSAVPNIGEFNLIWSPNKNQKYLGTLLNWAQKQYKQNFQKKIVRIPQNLIRVSVDGLKTSGLNRLADSCQSNTTISLKPTQNYRQFSYMPNVLRCHNHLQFHRHLTNKKNLFKNLKSYYQLHHDNPFDHIPLTFHLESEDSETFKQFEEYVHKNGQKLWIVKPGENTNRGNGIELVNSLEGIRKMVQKSRQSKPLHTLIVQKYIQPFLYEKRKFDIRCYLLVTSVNKHVKGYWYEDGYIRTSSKQFTLENINSRYVHLTNDAVQKKSEDYGKYEPANKISFMEFQKYLDMNHRQLDFWEMVYPEMMNLTRQALDATCHLLDPRGRQHTFQIYGLDFLIDEYFHPWLIQVNTNPCLEICCSLLGRIIPNMLDNAMKIALDTIFPPYKTKDQRHLKVNQPFSTNKFSLIFNKMMDKQIKIVHNIPTEEE